MPKAPAPVEERFWSKVDQSGDCWLWEAYCDARGYGRFMVPAGGGSWACVAAHRQAYALMVGAVPDGMELDHLCRNPRCVRPDHLEPVTHAENIRRGDSGAHYRNATHCKNGHEFTPENTYTGRGFRQCRACGNAAAQRYRKRQAVT